MPQCNRGTLYFISAVKYARSVGRTVVLDVVFVLFNHLLNHLAADGACLLGGEVAVVALVEVYAYFPWCTYTLL